MNLAPERNELTAGPAVFDEVRRGPAGEFTRRLEFTNPRRIVQAHNLAEVLPALREVDRAVQSGLWAVGFVAYEAAPAFDRAMETHPPIEGLPLLWFGLYGTPGAASESGPKASTRVGPRPASWQPSMTGAAYDQAIAGIKERIAAGDTYQVNYTLRMRAPIVRDPFDLFLQLADAQHSGYSAYLHTGRHAICSASPELFFDLEGATLRSRPMKGTALRGRTLAEDHLHSQRLHDSAKNRAENSMIVDMVRNDMARVAETGSVRVSRMFEIERYPTVLQMTSTVECRTRAPIPEIFSALFPCASVTGAPKIRTMQIIRDLEQDPRGVYTGAIGFIAPGGRAQFNVAIRTVVIDALTGKAEYGTGSGIIWDSDSAEEYQECLLKARVLNAVPRAFELLESLLWTPGGGCFLLERHLVRLRDSAEYFVYPFDEIQIRSKLAEVTEALPDGLPQGAAVARQNRTDPGSKRHPWPHLRLSFTPLRFRSSASPWPPLRCRPDDTFLFHKTTHREVYEQARAEHPGFDDVVALERAARGYGVYQFECRSSSCGANSSRRRLTVACSPERFARNYWPAGRCRSG